MPRSRELWHAGALSAATAVAAVAVLVCVAIWSVRHRTAALPTIPVKLLYCDGGHYFKFFEPAVRAALAPQFVEVVQPPAQPDVVVYSVEGNAHRSYPNSKKILFVGEPLFDPSLAQAADLTVHCTLGMPSALYIPFWVTSFGERRRHAPSDMLKKHDQVLQAIPKKTEFCAFLYSRPAREREALFDIISTYKPVTALGRARNQNAWAGQDRAVYTEDVTYMDLAVDKYRLYKFVICGENSRRAGYVTEKIVNAMLAHAIPIYIGAPDITDHFDPASFIDASRLSVEQLIAEVQRLDTDDDAYREMLLRPWLRGNMLPRWFDVAYQSSLFRKGMERQ